MEMPDPEEKQDCFGPCFIDSQGVLETSPMTAFVNTRSRITKEYRVQDIEGYFSSFDNGKLFRSLYLYFCGPMGAAVDVERLWSAAGNLHTPKRNRIQEKTISTELFLKANKSISIPSPLPSVTNMEEILKLKVENLLLEDNYDPCPLAIQIINNEEDSGDASDLDYEFDADDLDACLLKTCDVIESQIELDVEEDEVEEDEMAVEREWNCSNAPKNFNNELKRKRSSFENIDDMDMQLRSKRIKKAQWSPQLGDSVLIAYEEDCLCKKGVLLCKCKNVWFEGIYFINT